MLSCPLCAYEFDPEGLSCVGRCPLAVVQGCNLICCPNCGYEMVNVDKSRWVQWLRRAGRVLAPPPAANQEARPE